MARGGYIKLHRSIIEWEWFQDGNTYRLFTYLLLLANTEDKYWQGVEIKRGELATSSESLARALHLGRTQVRVALKKLERSEITSRVTNKFTIIHINNYELYQAREGEDEKEQEQEQPANQPTSNQQVTSKQPTSNQQVTTIKKHKKHKKQEEGIIPTPISPSEKSDKKQYAPHVSMTEGEYQKLCEKVSPSGAIRCVEILDAYKEASGKKYQSDYGAMRNWVINRYYEELDKGPPGLRRQQAPAREQETQQERNSRALREARERAEKEEMASGSQQDANYRDIRADQRQLPD